MQSIEAKSLVADPEPDVWWGPDGIDAMCWSDGIPYEYEGGGE